jgi:hypothetical protein
VSHGETVSISDARPLARAAEILMSHYGVPISYEDLSAYAYDGDLAETLDLPVSNALGSTLVASKTLAPRKSNLTFFAEPLKVGFHPPSVDTADPASVARVLQGVLNQHENNGNPGQFKLVETPAGLAIVPKATRSTSGAPTADQSLLDLRISFPEREGEADGVLIAFVKALKEVSGKQVEVEGIGGPAIFSGRIGARNEVARDVLARLLTGLIHYGGINDGRPVPKLVWNLTTYPGINPPHAASYHIGFKTVVMEGRDQSGRIVNRGIPVLPGTVDH